jgi:SPASM domain peptide maturase of grasp-with-spasm system
MFNDLDTYFKLYPSSILVKGFGRSTICDIHKNRYFTIPNQLYEILNFNEKNTIKVGKLFEIYIQEKEGLKKYIKFFINEKYGFYTNVPKNFPKFSMEWDYPSRISNSVLDFNNFSDYLNDNFIKDIINTGCTTFQLRFFEPITVIIINRTIDIIHKKTEISNIEIVMPYNTRFENLIHSKFKISRLYMYNSPFDRINFDKKNICLVEYLKNGITDESSCGKITENCFNCNIDNFTESQNFNSCLNRKIGVTKNGEYKNCPSMKKSYGNVRNTKLSTVLNSIEFKNTEKISKDKISVCKDCEFRYVCSDCRAYLVDPNDIFSKPLKCKYDPYTNVWSK